MGFSSLGSSNFSSLESSFLSSLASAFASFLSCFSWALSSFGVLSVSLFESSLDLSRTLVSIDLILSSWTSTIDSVSVTSIFPFSSSIFSRLISLVNSWFSLEVPSNVSITVSSTSTWAIWANCSSGLPFFDFLDFLPFLGSASFTFAIPFSSYSNSCSSRPFLRFSLASCLEAFFSFLVSFSPVFCLIFPPAFLPAAASVLSLTASSSRSFCCFFHSTNPFSTSFNVPLYRNTFSGIWFIVPLTSSVKSLIVWSTGTEIPFIPENFSATINGCVRKLVTLRAVLTTSLSSSDSPLRPRIIITSCSWLYCSKMFRTFDATL